MQPQADTIARALTGGLGFDFIGWSRFFHDPALDSPTQPHNIILIDITHLVSLTCESCLVSNRRLSSPRAEPSSMTAQALQEI